MKLPLHISLVFLNTLLTRAPLLPALLSQFLSVRRLAKCDLCLLSQRAFQTNDVAVEASDGRVYDLDEFARWISFCKRQQRPNDVVPTQRITSFRFVRLQVCQKPLLNVLSYDSNESDSDEDDALIPREPM